MTRAGERPGRNGTNAAGSEFEGRQTPAAGLKNAAFASASGQVTMNHAKTFLSEITAFLVEERRWCRGCNRYV